MTPGPSGTLRVAIACGGTGGHLFPGLAVGEQLVGHGCAVTLLVSLKEIDQAAVKSVSTMNVVTLPAIGLTKGRLLAFVRAFCKSYRVAKKHFEGNPPQAALAMGGFTSAPPLISAKLLGAKTYLHESNAVAGRANRWLSHFVDTAFLGFSSAAHFLHARRVLRTGTPVRAQFKPADIRTCRIALGLDPDTPVILITGGSQGASALNQMVIQTISLLLKAGHNWQWFHLTGPTDVDQVKQAYAKANVPAVVHSFFLSMELALGAATAAISRAGASFLAELAAMRVPALLVPYPMAVDDHQLHNARAFEATRAARLLMQRELTPEVLAQQLVELVQNTAERETLQTNLGQWHSPDAAAKIAESMLQGVVTTGMRRYAGLAELSVGCTEPTDAAAPRKNVCKADPPSLRLFSSGSRLPEYSLLPQCTSNQRRSP